MLSPNNTFTYNRKTTSLANLLLASHLSLAAIAIFAFAIAMFIMTYRATYRQAEGELLGAAESMAQDLRSGIRPMDLTVPEAFFHRFGKAPRDQAYWVVWDGEGKQLAAEGNLEHAIAMSDSVPKRSGPRPFVTRTSGRILELIIATSDGGQLLVGRSLAKEFDAMGRLLVRLAAFLMFGLIASGLVAWWMSDRISKPIIELSQRAKQFTQYQLDKRLAINQPTREMSELAVAFNSMIENLEQAFDQQSQFTSDAAHELRRPVSVILSQSEYGLSRDRLAEDGNTNPTISVNMGHVLTNGGTVTVSTSQLQATDAEQSNPGSLLFTISALPSNGQPRKSGTALALNGTFTQADINNNLISYLHPGGANTSDSFQFTLSDGAGGSITNQSFALTIAPKILLSEIKANPPGSTAAGDKYQYIELRGAPGATLNNVYDGIFDGNGSSIGTAAYVKSLIGQSLGTNGLLVIKSPTAGHSVASGTTVVTDSKFDTVAGGVLSKQSVSFYLAYATSPLVEGTEYDVDDNGTLDSNFPSGSVPYIRKQWVGATQRKY